MAFKTFASLVVVQLAIAPQAHAVSVVTESPIPTPASHPSGIGAAFEGLWFSEYDSNKIAKIDEKGSITEIAIPTPGSGPEGITVFADGRGRIGFTEFKANKIGRVDLANNVTEFPIPTPNAGPRGIVVGGGQNFWFTEFNANKIGLLSADDVFSEYSIGTPSSGPLAITEGPSGISCCNTDIWFTEYRGNKIGRLNQQGLLTEYAIPTPNSGPSGITQGHNGDFALDAVWFTELNANKIGRVTPDGVIQEFNIPTPNSGPLGIFVSAGVWFTESRANKIARLNLDGSIDEFPIPTPNSAPTGLYGTWFVESDGNKIGHVVPDWLVAVGAGHAGVWDTEFDLANGQSHAAMVNVGARPPRICIVCFRTTITLGVPPLGVRHVAASETGTSEGFDTFLLSTGLTPDDDLPTTRARIVNRALPSQSSEIPVIRYSAIRRFNPSILTFPTSTRDLSTRTNLVIAEVSAEGTEVTVLVEAYTADGELAGRSQPISLAASETREIVDVLRLLDVANLQDGQIRVTKISGDGLLWGLLATATEDGLLFVSPGANP